jgi:16S rRNA (guanine527-N7)-methyltransferase
MKLMQELKAGLEEFRLELSTQCQKQLIDYILLLHKWNKVYNLTAIQEPEQMVSHHLLDCLAIVPHLWVGRWLDVGCGAGLPGLVIAMAKPDWQVVLLDSNSKKTGFVQQAIIELGLQNASVHCARVEDFTATDKFDGITSRAFASLGDFCQSTRHLLKPEGHWVAMKGLAEKEKLENVPINCVIEKVITLNVPEINAARSLVIVSLKETG